MNKYAVRIHMTITKTYQVEADSEESAIELALENSTPTYEEDVDERFHQEWDDIRLIDGE